MRVSLLMVMSLHVHMPIFPNCHAVSVDALPMVNVYCVSAKLSFILCILSNNTLDLS